MVQLFPALEEAFCAAGPGHKNPPRNPADAQAVGDARRNALCTLDPLFRNVDRKPAWLASEAGRDCCVACKKSGATVKSALDCRCRARHGPEMEDFNAAYFPLGATVACTKEGKVFTGTVVAFDRPTGRHTLNCNGVERVEYLGYLHAHVTVTRAWPSARARCPR